MGVRVSATLRGVTDTSRWTIGNLKGGVGKTTTAVGLALALAETPGARVLLIDADPSSDTTSAWTDLAGDAWPATIQTVRWTTPALAGRVRETAGAGTHVVIDTGPAAPEVLRAALSVTDLLVLPLRPSAADVLAVQPTIDTAADAAAARDPHAPALGLRVVLTQVVARTVSARETRAALSARGIPVAETEIPRREALAQAVGQTTTPDPYRTLTQELSR